MKNTTHNNGKAHTPPLIAVISGDIIGSTDLSDEEYDTLLRVLRDSLNFIVNDGQNDTQQRRHLNNKFEMSRGDFFQLIVHDSENAAKYALLIRTGLKQVNDAFDCRLSIGLGREIKVRETVGSSTGDAFVASGRALESMKSATLTVNTFDVGLTEFSEFFALLTQYVDHQISDMTARQCAITHILLKEKESITQGEIAEKLGANRVSINRSMKSANTTLIIEYTHLFSKKIKALS